MSAVCSKKGSGEMLKHNIMLIERLTNAVYVRFLDDIGFSAPPHRRYTFIALSWLKLRSSFMLNHWKRLNRQRNLQVISMGHPLTPNLWWNLSWRRIFIELNSLSAEKPNLEEWNPSIRDAKKGRMAIVSPMEMYSLGISHLFVMQRREFSPPNEHLSINLLWT